MQYQIKTISLLIKKGANIYGIIFGASHIRAVDKFLTIAWKRNEINGEANFDIEDDEVKAQGELFKKPSKIETFQKNVRTKILAGEITNNLQLFDYTLAEGHIGKHAADELRKMKKNGEVFFEGTSPLVTYEKTHGKEKRKLEYNILKS